MNCLGFRRALLADSTGRAKASALSLTAVVVPAAGGSGTVIARSPQSVGRIAWAPASQGGS